MKRYFVIMFAGALMGMFALALQGRLLGPDGQPFGGARIVVVGQAGTVLADAEGRFRLESVPPPPFEIVVMRPDGVALRPVSVTRLPEDGVLEIRLESAANDTVTVVAGIVPDLELPPAAAATVIGRGDLELRVPARLPDALENIPGSGVTGEGQSAVPALRGLSKGRTLILLDDGRVTAERRAGPSASFLDPETVGELEVIRGPGSVAYGSDAFGGIIRARTRLASPGEPASGRLYLFGAAGTAGGGGSAEGSAPLAGGAVLAGAHWRRFADYRSPAGTVPDSGATLGGARIGYQSLLAGGVLRLGWRSDLARDVGKPAVDSDTIGTDYPVEDSHRFNAAFERPGPGAWSRLAASVAWDAYRLVLDRDRYPTAVAPGQLSRSDTDARDYEARFEAERTWGEDARLVLGASANGRYGLQAVNTTFTYGPDGIPTGITTEVSIADARRDDLAVFSALDGRVGRWSWGGGIRADRVSSRNRGGYFGDRDTAKAAASGFLAGGVDVRPDLSVNLQLARGFRDATLSDRYYRGVTGRGFVTGNPDLRPETSLQVDASANWTPGPLRLAVYGYWYRIRDLIERYKAGNDYYLRNRGEATVRGVELEGSADLAGALRLDFGAHYLQGESDDTGDPTDDVPASGAFVTLRRDPRRAWWWLVRAAAVARDERPGPTERVVPGYAICDAGAGCRLAESLELDVLVRNLFDACYPGSADEKAALAPGISLQVGLRATF
jgi:outer membrane receptor protein involved in Fe transport